MPPWLVHFNVNIVNVLHSKYAIKFILKCMMGINLEKLASRQNRE